MTPNDRSMFFRAIRAGWSRASSADPAGWNASNPAWGQCAVTALVIQDVLGGDLLRVVVGDQTHYFNRLPGGEVIDLTREQFGPRPIPNTPVTRERSYVLSFPDTERRYLALREAVERTVLAVAPSDDRGQGDSRKSKGRAVFAPLGPLARGGPNRSEVRDRRPAGSRPSAPQDA